MLSIESRCRYCWSKFSARKFSIAAQTADFSTVTNMDKGGAFQHLVPIHRPSIIESSVGPYGAPVGGEAMESCSSVSQLSPDVHIFFGRGGVGVNFATSTPMILEQWRKLLQHWADVRFTFLEPRASYRETVSKESTKPGEARSPDGHTTMTILAKPLGEKVIRQLENCSIGRPHGPTDTEAGNALGLVSATYLYRSSVLVNSTTSSDLIDKFQENLITGCLSTLVAGPLTQLPMCGVRFDITNVSSHIDTTNSASSSDSNHPKDPDMHLLAQEATQKAVALAETSLQGPYYMVEIMSPKDNLATIQDITESRRGVLQKLDGSDAAFPVSTYSLPASESLYLYHTVNEALGHVVRVVFDGYKILSGSPSENGTVAFETVTKMREMMKRE